MQARLDALQVGVPAGDRQTAAGFVDAAVGDQIELAVTHFDARGRLADARDELRLAIDEHLAGRQRGGGFEPPAAVEPAAQPVLHAVAAAIEIEPDLPLQAQLVVGAERIAALLLG